MIVSAKVIRYDGQQLLLAPDSSIDKTLLQKSVKSVELRLNDGRAISNDQRRKIFAVIRDIALWNGDDPESLRVFLTWDFMQKYNVPAFSLSDVDMTTAKEFINYLIDFCFRHSVPTKDTLLNQNDDIGKYLYMCLEHRKCAICNMPAEVHHVDRIGMGRGREKVVHVGLKAIALCRKHHEQAHKNEKQFFQDNHIYGIKLDKYLCEKLSLKSKQEEV